MSETFVHGLGEVVGALQQFPEKLQRRALTQVMRRGGRMVMLLAKNLVPAGSGRLRRSIRVQVVRRGQYVTARIIAGRSRKKDDPYYALFVHEGTKPHEIRPRGKKSLFLAGLFAEVVKHPGSRSNKFLLKALEGATESALAAMQDELAAQIEQMGDRG